MSSPMMIRMLGGCCCAPAANGDSITVSGVRIADIGFHRMSVLPLRPGCPASGLTAGRGSETERGGEDRPLHVDVEAEIEAAARCVVKVEAGVTEVKIEPWGGGVVDGADQLPIAMCADAKAADIAIASQAEPAGQKPAGKVDVVASADQRIDPAGRTIGARSGQNPGV